MNEQPGTWEWPQDRSLRQALEELAGAAAQVVDWATDDTLSPAEHERWMGVASGIVAGLSIASEGIEKITSVQESIDQGFAIMRTILMEEADRRGLCDD